MLDVYADYIIIDTTDSSVLVHKCSYEDMLSYVKEELGCNPDGSTFGPYIVYKVVEMEIVPPNKELIIREKIE